MQESRKAWPTMMAAMLVLKDSEVQVKGGGGGGVDGFELWAGMSLAPPYV